MVTNVVGSTNVLRMLFNNGTIVVISAPDKKVYGLHVLNARISFRFDVDCSNVDVIIIDNCC